METPFNPGHARERHHRVSAFTEIGIGASCQAHVASAVSRDARDVVMQPGQEVNRSNPESEATEQVSTSSWYTAGTSRLRSLLWFKPAAAANSSSPPAALPSMPHVALVMVLLALVIPGIQHSITFGRLRFAGNGVDGGVLRNRADVQLAERDDSPTDICKRWSHQSAVVNGTLYIYGGQATTDPDQKGNTWNNDFLALPLTKTWQIGSPTLQGLPQPSGPPAVANGYLWNSLTSLYLYGGLFSDEPATSPVPFGMWEYNIPGSAWIEHNNTQTSAGNNSAPDNVPVQRAAEGAGLSVPELGRGWYFGGHLDGYTTPGWPQSVPRVYLKSLLEFTFPGFTNDGVQSLSGGKNASPDGVWRNITDGGLQDAAGFTERADGILAYVPGFGQDGVILGLAGGTNTTFTQMNVIDVYDVANSTWYKQATSGNTPPIRVDPCAVVAAAPDGSSFNVYMYAGQNLIPYGSQEQYNDMWILTVPSFTWIQVNMTGQSNPPARAGHTCNIWDGQMVVVGGYVSQNISCDSPGIYVFDLSKLQWQPQFNALSGSNPQGQQESQQKEEGDGGADVSAIGLEGSYGYTVPAAVQSVVGGNGNGGATVTTPVESATAGPIATGRAPTFTVTGPGGTVTETGTPGYKEENSGPNVGAIVAGVVAGVFAILAGYLGFCAWIYRRQLQLYKNHVAMSQRQAGSDGPSGREKGTFAALLPRSSGASSERAKWTPDNAPSGSSTAYTPVAGQTEAGGGHSTANSSTDDLMAGQEPSFLGVLLSPRRSLRVINRD